MQRVFWGEAIEQMLPIHGIQNAPSTATLQ